MVTQLPPIATLMKVTPFSIAPDPSYLYLTPSIEGIIQKVEYVIDYRQGLTAILGDVGLGKSSVLKLLHGRFDAREEYAVALISTPNHNSDFSLLKGICQDFELPMRRSMLAQENELKAFLFGLYTNGRNAVVFIDEAQKLTGPQMELLRTLNNIESKTHKLLQIVIAAQRELENKLQDESKKAIKSRIVFPSFLSVLTPDEAVEMLKFRCDRANIRNPFDIEAMRRMYDTSNGNPRNLLKVADFAFMRMRAVGMNQLPAELIDDDLVREAMLR